MRLRFPLIVLAALACMLGAAPELRAQLGGEDTLRILRIDTDAFPTVRVYVRAFCAGVQTSAVTSIDVNVTDGVQRAFTVQCPNNPVPISVAFALDRSGSVAGSSIYRIQEGAWDFVNLMQVRATGTDEAAIVSFADNVTVDQMMTTNTNDLLDAISKIFSFGTTALWDGVMTAIYQVEHYGTNPVKAVIALSDGGDNSSLSTLRDVIDYARRVNIPVYSICVTYHASTEEVKYMRMVADSTGGRFIPVFSPGEIVDAYNTLASMIAGGGNDCVIEYKVECPDGGWREAHVTMQACGKTLSQSKRYRVPLDPMLPSVTLTFDAAAAYEGGDLFLPIRITATGDSARLTNLSFKVFRLDEMQFVRAITGPYLAGRFASVDVTPAGDTLRVRLDGSVSVLGTDTLMVLQYKVAPAVADSTYPLIIFDLDKQTQNCMRLATVVNDFRLFPRATAQPACSDTLQVKWDPATGSYAPGITTITATVTNPGSVTAHNTRAWIRLPYGVRLAGGTDTVALGVPMLEAGKSAQISFPVSIIPSDSARQFTVCVYAQPDSGVITQCCAVINVEAGKPALRMWCDMPASIRWVDSLGRFDPPEFPVRIHVTNISPVTARASEAWIHVPEGFVVTGSTPVNTVPSPSTLKQSDTGTVVWMVRVLDRMTSDTLRFCVKTAAGFDTAVCCQNVYVTKSPVRGSLTCQNPSAITWDEEKREWTPPQFLVSTVVRNTSGNPMYSAQGTLLLPSFLTFAPGETPVKNLPGGAVVQSGDSAIVTWTVRGAGPPPDSAEVCILISASNFPGARCCVPLLIKRIGAAPQLSCTLTGPDTIRYTETGYVPNPFTLQLTVRNTGTAQANQVYAALLQGADISIEAPDQALKRVADSLVGGASVQSGFTVRVLDRTVSRTDTVRVSVYAANGGAMVCEKAVYIEGVRGSRIELSCGGPDSLVFSDSLNTYLPDPFTVTLSARNTGTLSADSVVAEFLPPGNVVLASGEQSAKMLQPSLLAPGASGIASWQAGAVRRATAGVDTIRAQVKVKGKTTSPIVPCPVLVYVPAARSAALDLQCIAPASPVVTGGRYSPDPLVFRVRIRNNGDARAFDLAATVISQGRLQLAPGEQQTKQLGVLAPGGAETEVLWSFTALPQSAGDTVTVCFRVSARFQNDVTCCARIWLPPLEAGTFALGCAAPDTVHYDTLARRWPNPVTVSATVRNTGTVRLDSVRVTIAPASGLALSAGEPADRVLRDIDAGATARADWKVDVIADTSTVIKERGIRFTAYANGDVRTCDRTLVLVPPPPLPVDTSTASVSVRCFAPDTIRFNQATQKPEPSPFTVLAEIVNTGSATITQGGASLLTPPNVSFGTGETPTKYYVADLKPGDTTRIRWTVFSAVDDSIRVSGFRFMVVYNGHTVYCDASTVVMPRSGLIEFSIPKTLLGREGELTDVPIRYRNPLHVRVDHFAVDMRYDAALLEFVQNFPHTLQAEWAAVTCTDLTPDVLRFAGTSAIPLGDEGVLAGAVFRVRRGAASQHGLWVVQSPLELFNPVTPVGIQAVLSDGLITLMGDCLVPLYGDLVAKLQQNAPNPFNPATTIRYELPAGGPWYVRVEVFDAFGRTVRVLADGPVDAGVHSAMFDAGNLPSGVYYCRMTVDGRTAVRPMMLSR